jgi:hypothetical protein
MGLLCGGRHCQSVLRSRVFLGGWRRSCRRCESELYHFEIRDIVMFHVPNFFEGLVCHVGTYSLHIKPLTFPFPLAKHTHQSILHTPHRQPPNSIIQLQHKPHCHTQQQQPLLHVPEHIDTRTDELRCRTSK